MSRQREPEYLTVKEIAERFQCTPAHIYAEIGLSRLRCVRIARRKGIRVHRDDLAAWLQAINRQPVTNVIERRSRT